MSTTVLGNTAPARLCPGPAHPCHARRHCAGKYCLEVSGGMITLWWCPGSLLDLADVLASYDAIRDLSDGYLMPLIVHLQGMVGMTAAARSVITEGSLSSRVGFVGTGPVDEVIAAFLEDGLSETHYFEHVHDAEAWARAA